MELKLSSGLRLPLIPLAFKPSKLGCTNTYDSTLSLDSFLLLFGNATVKIYLYSNTLENKRSSSIELFREMTSKIKVERGKQKKDMTQPESTHFPQLRLRLQKPWVNDTRLPRTIAMGSRQLLQES